LKNILDAAFAHPQGLRGRLGGLIMARVTGKRNEWTISLLTLEENDHILDVGSGPGALIQMLAARVPKGFIAGIDASPVMVKQASQRNVAAIRAGLIEIKQGSALELPFENAFFNKALSANSVSFWPDQLAGVKEMRRVLKPGGTIALILQPMWAKTESEVKEIGSGLVNLLQTADFQQTRLEFKPMKPVASVCALGIK
jgi:ubiquinone/menaquinone biosynthesis C-methylase UbiE